MRFLRTIRKKFFRELAVTCVVLTCLVALVFHLFIPERYFLWFPAIPVFFYLVGVLYIELVSLYYRMNANKLVHCYLICKVAKLLACAAFMIAYAIAVGHEITTFMVTFIFFFFAFLIFETKFFVRFEMKMKNRKK